MSSLLSHVPFASLVDLVEGRVRGDERIQLMRHVDSCQRCRTELAQVERLIGIMRSDLSEDAPAHVIARAVRLFQPPQSQAAPNLLQRVVAALRFDSATLAPTMGVRSTPDGQPAAARQLLYSTGEYDLDVRITPAGDAWIVAGQVLNPTDGGRAELQGSNSVVQAPLNDLSEFTLAPTPVGSYKLLVHLNNLIVEVIDLKVGV